MDLSTIGLLSLGVAFAGLISGLLYRVRSDVLKKAEEALEKARAVELMVSRDYVSMPALRIAIADVLREVQTGFAHINEKITDLSHQVRKQTGHDV